MDFIEIPNLPQKPVCLAIGGATGLLGKNKLSVNGDARLLEDYIPLMTV